jgi:hypothetical protein
VSVRGALGSDDERDERANSTEAAVKLAQIKPNVFTLTATSQELTALVAAARMALEVMRTDPGVPPETLALVTRVLVDYDRALARREVTDGRVERPSVDSREDDTSAP